MEKTDKRNGCNNASLFLQAPHQLYDDKGRYSLSKLDCVILFITPTSCIGLVGENRLRGNSSNYEPDYRLFENLDGQTGSEQPKIGDPGMGQKKDLKVDEFVEITMSSRKTSKQRRIEEVLRMLTDTDTLVVTELSRLGRSTAEVIALVNEFVARNIRVIILKQNLDISQHDMNSKLSSPFSRSLQR